MKENIQTSAEYLANLCLENSETHQNYTDKDLENATIIFSYFLMDVAFDSIQNLSFNKQLEMAETMGKALRELIKVSTGKDMHEIVKQ